MQDYIEIAQKKGFNLIGFGACQFCGADTQRGVHECVEIFSLGFQLIDYSRIENHLYRFLAVDAHTLQHPEIHGRWNNHFHLTRQHLMFEYKMEWNYKLSPKLSNYLNEYKIGRENEYLEVPPLLKRGEITCTHIMKDSKTEQESQNMILKWGTAVYQSWKANQMIIDSIAKGFIQNIKQYGGKS